MAWCDTLFSIIGYSYEPSEQELRIKGVNACPDCGETIDIVIKNPTQETITAAMEAYDHRYARPRLLIGLQGNTAWKECEGFLEHS